jgi:hypothetical protein
LAATDANVSGEISKYDTGHLAATQPTPAQAGHHRCDY